MFSHSGARSAPLSSTRLATPMATVSGPEAAAALRRQGRVVGVVDRHRGGYLGRRRCTPAHRSADLTSAPSVHRRNPTAGAVPPAEDRRAARRGELRGPDRHHRQPAARVDRSATGVYRRLADRQSGLLHRRLRQAHAPHRHLAGAHRPGGLDSVRPGGVRDRRRRGHFRGLHRHRLHADPGDGASHDPRRPGLYQHRPCAWVRVDVRSCSM